MLLCEVEPIRQELAQWASGPLVALDTETSGLDPLVDRVLLVALSNGQQTLLCDVRALEPQACAAALAPLLEGPAVKVMHHARYDVRMLRALGAPTRWCADTLLNELVLEGGRTGNGHGLAELCQRHLGVHLSKEERMGFTHMGSQGGFSPAQLEYARRDVLATWQLFMHQLPRLVHDGLSRTARLESRLVPAVADMEQQGIHVDVAGWHAAAVRAQADMDAARAEADRHFATVCNMDLLGSVDLNYESEPDVREALGRLGVRVETLSNDALRTSAHPAAAALVRYREAHKHVSTYGTGFLEHVHPRTGRVHATFRQVGASTGRMSCERPNLQNIPRDSHLRACFSAPAGRMLITADYAACELRILAHLSSDPVFRRAFEHGEDVHAQVASSIFGIPVTKTSHPELRERAKTISFGLIYGMGAAGLAAQTGQTLPEAEALLKAYFGHFPRIEACLKGLEQAARSNGYARTVWGRRLYLDRESWERNAGGTARLARNMPIQGTSADITKLAMVYLHEALEGSGAFLVNCVHDELLVECPAQTAADVAQCVKATMERAMAAVVPTVPPLADVRVGPTWSKG